MVVGFVVEIPMHEIIINSVLNYNTSIRFGKVKIYVDNINYNFAKQRYRSQLDQLVGNLEKCIWQVQGKDTEKVNFLYI